MSISQQPTNSVFERDLKEWVELDKQYDFLQEKMRTIRERKTILLQKISEYAKQRNLENKVINIPSRTGDNTKDIIKICSTRVYTPLSIKYLEKTLGDIIKNQGQLEQTIKYIKNKREVKVVTELKRVD
jgi:hypothetical protein